MNNEAIVYLLRKTSLTREGIGKLMPCEYNAIVREVYYQESVEDYRRQHSVASIMAAIYNTIPRKRGSKVYKSSDFLQGGPPERNPKQDTIDQMADRRGIKLPAKELKERT